MKKIFSCFTIFISFVFYQNVSAWDNDVTHKDLSRFASENSVLDKNKGDYLKKLGFEGGLKEEFKWNGVTKIVSDWFTEGAFLEDAGSNWDILTNKGRFNNHFHNPLKSWSEAGLNDYLIIPNPYPPFIPYTYSVFGKSPVIWAQDSTYQASFREGNWSWQKIREYYYIALTGKDFTGTIIAPTKEKRDEHFAKTFRGLGHQIHLIQDMAQPAHVRNDAHPLDGMGIVEGLETWAKRNPDKVNSFLATPVFPQVSLNVSPDGLVPITQFIDTKQYKNDTRPSTSLTWGLSEYTNSNFVSDDTIFTESLPTSHRHYFPYPRYSISCYELYDEYVSPDKKRTYLRKKCDGETVGHFAAAGPLFKYLNSFPLIQRLTLKLDSATYKDYSENLIPRAVGYSAGLLNYFFRGEIKVKAQSVFEVGKMTKLQMKIKNVTTTQEAMGIGDLSLVCSYDSESNGKIYVTAAETLAVIALNYDDVIDAEFNFTEEQQIPIGASNSVKCTIAFQGNLGMEQNAVIGKTFAPCIAR